MVKKQSSSRVFRWLAKVLIANGGEKEASPYPDCVMVFKHDGFHCSGVVIAPRVVATAAHCVKDVTHKELSVKVGPSKKHIVGAFDLRGSVPHHEYEELLDQSHWNDIALLILKEDIPVTASAVANRSRLLQASSGTMVGYGSNEPNGGNGEGVRRASKAVKFEAFLCRDANGKVVPCSLNTSVEVILSGDKYTVEEGDSGGGLYLSTGLVAGVASRKFSSAEAQIVSNGSVYVWLDAHRTFILNECTKHGVNPPRFVS